MRGQPAIAQPTTRAGVGVDNHGEVEEPFTGAQIVDVRDPQPVGCFGGELPLHQIWCGRRRGIRVAGLLRLRRWAPSLPARRISRATALWFQRCRAHAAGW